MLPAIIGSIRNHNHQLALWLITPLVAWTIIGWLLMGIWAVFGNSLDQNSPVNDGTKLTKPVRVFVGALAIFVATMLIAGILTVVASTVLGGATVFGTKMVGAAEANMLFLVFLVSFLGSIILGTTFIVRRHLANAQSRARSQVGIVPKARKS